MENMDGVITNSSSSCYKTVADGEYAVGLSYEDADLQLLLDGAQNIQVVYMEEGTTACGFAGAIIKNCKNMEAAKAFMDFITDPDLQSERANVLGCMRPTNSKAEYESEFMPKTDEVKWTSRTMNIWAPTNPRSWTSGRNSGPKLIPKSKKSAAVREPVPTFSL